MATHTLPHPSALPQISKHGILVLNGYGVRISVKAGHLCVSDGIGSDRRDFRLPRVGYKLARIVCISNDGTVTFSALDWLSNVGASFILLDGRGKIQFVTGPTAPFEARLRRAQSLALTNGTALKISKGLIAQKLDGQARVARDMLNDPVKADAIVRLGNELLSANNISSVRVIESQAAKFYWSAWYGVPIRWPRNEEHKVPDHWKQFGTRISPLSGSPRLAINPAGAILNLLYALLESESRLACTAMGLDPAVGVLHVDQSSRDSLALDVLEPVRAKCDAFLLHWLQTEPLRRSDYFEMPNGNARIMTALAVKLCQTADTWRRFAAPAAEYVATELAASIPKSRNISYQGVATRLTQRRKRDVKGSNVPAVSLPNHREHVCTGCGTRISRSSEQCASCTTPIALRNLEKGRALAHEAESRAKRSATNKAQAELIKKWNPAENPAWLTREFYISKIMPALTHVSKAQIRASLHISEPHAIYIQRGKRVPHARHWKALGELADVKSSV